MRQKPGFRASHTVRHGDRAGLKQPVIWCFRKKAGSVKMS